MIIDWRAKAYRGGSRWISSGVLAVAVGVTVAATEALPDIAIVGTYTRILDVAGSYSFVQDVTGTYQHTLTITGEKE